MGTVNAINPKVDQTVRIFDNFYQFEVTVDANEYDTVNSFFLSIFKSASAADSFSSALFRISDETNVPVLTLLDQIREQDAIQLTQTMTYYLNGLRSPATLLGISAVTQPNYWTARNILP